MAEPSAVPYIFVSYASADRDRVLPIVEALQRAGVAVWIDREGIHGGANYGREIAEAIRGASALVLITSPLSLASRNVRQEIALAWEYERPYVPLLLEAVAIPDDVKYWLTAAQWVEVLDRPEGAWLPQVLAALAPLGVVPPATAPAPHEQLAGREREQALLREHLAAALAGRGGLVLVGGEAGVGKTTLAEALCREATARGALVLVGRCYDLAETPPYGPWLEIIARYPAAPGLPPLPAAVTDRAALAAVAGQAALFDQVLAWFAAVAAARPLVLLLDDLHWADPASLDLLRTLARTLAGLPLLLLATYRADELTRRHPLYALLPALVREAQATRLDLHPLDEAALEALVAARYALPDADAARLVASLRARAEGNPFYAGELLRTLEEGGILARDGDAWRLGDLAGGRVPPLLRQVIEARVARLGEGARALLAMAAAIGPAVPLDLWAAVAGVGEEALLEPVERAAEAGLLTEAADGASVRFAHALIREALYEGTAAIRRRAWHRRAGEALTATPQPDPDAVAYHFRQAGDPRAGEWLVQAGERAQRTYAWVTAAERFEAALPLLPGDPATAGARGWLLLRIGLLRRYSDQGQALAYLEGAIEAAQAAGDGRLAAHAGFACGLVRGYGYEVAACVAAMGTALAALEALPPAEPAARAALRAAGLADDLDAFRGTYALWLAIAGACARASALAGAVADRLPATMRVGVLDGAFAPDALSALCVAHATLGRPAEARRIRRRLEAYRASGDLHQVGVSALTELFQGVLPYQTDDLAARRALAAEAREALARAGQAGASSWPPRSGDVLLLLLEGRWGELRELLIVLDDLPNRAWLFRWGMAIVGALARAQGDAARVWALVGEVLPGGAATEPGDQRFLSTLPLVQLAAAVALDAGDLGEARAWLDMQDRWLAWSGAILGQSEGRALWAAYHLAAGDPVAALAHAEAALAHASDPRQPLALLAAHRLRGELDTATGDFAAARTHLGESLALADACAAPYERALTLLAQAELRAAEGQPDTARALLAEVRAICEPLGARPTLDRAEALAVALATD